MADRKPDNLYTPTSQSNENMPSPKRRSTPSPSSRREHSPARQGRQLDRSPHENRRYIRHPDPSSPYDNRSFQNVDHMRERMSGREGDVPYHSVIESRQREINVQDSRPIFLTENPSLSQGVAISALQQMQRKYSPIPFSGYAEPKVMLNRLEVTIPENSSLGLDSKLSPGSLRRFSPAHKISPVPHGLSPYEMRPSPLAEGRPSPVLMPSISPIPYPPDRRPSPAHMPERVSPMPIMTPRCTPPPAHGAHHRPHMTSPSVFVGNFDSPEESKPSLLPTHFGGENLHVPGPNSRSSLSPASFVSVSKSRLSPVTDKKSPTPEGRPSPTPRKAHLLRAVPESDRRSPNRPGVSPVRETDHQFTPSPSRQTHRVSPVPLTHSPSKTHDVRPIGVNPDKPLQYHSPLMQTKVLPVPGKPLLSAQLGVAPFVPQNDPRHPLLPHGLMMHVNPIPPVPLVQHMPSQSHQQLAHPVPVQHKHLHKFSGSENPQALPSQLISQVKSPPQFFRKAVSDMAPFRMARKATDDSDGEGMPKLTPEGLWPNLPDHKPFQQPVLGTSPGTAPVPTVELKIMPNPFNKRVQILNNFPTNSANYRSSYRSQSVAMHRARCCCITSAAKSLDILRQNLQKNINKEIDEVIQKYMAKFFQPGIENIRLNNGQNSVSSEHIHAVSRQILEEAKKMYTCERPRSTTPVRDISDNMSDSGSTSGTRIRIPSRRRRPSETDSDISAPVKRKKKGRPPLNMSGRGTPSKTLKSHSPVRREGPKWDGERLKPDSLFVMGARANKALGLGATRGRLYIKHPDVFKYSGDQDDKQWLFDNHHMPATGGKAYMLLVEDINELAESEEYRDSPNLLLDEILGFSVPEWMLEKMKLQMASLRTDAPKPKSGSRSRSGTPDNRTSVTVPNENKLPFSAFSRAANKALEIKAESSPSNTEDMDMLSTGDNDDQNTIEMSPLNMGGGFDDVNSDLDALDEAPFLSQ